MCSRRIKALYDTTNLDKDSGSGYVKICKSDDIEKDNMLYPNNINNIPGLQYLLNLYYFYLIQDIDVVNISEKEKIEREFLKLREALNSVYVESEASLSPLMQDVEDRLNRSLVNLERVNNTNLKKILKKIQLILCLKN